MPDEKDVAAQLAKVFPKALHKTRRGRGRSLTYIETHNVIKRLNDVLGPLNWSFKILEKNVSGNQKEVLVLGELSTGEISKQQYGGKEIICSKSTGQPLSLIDDTKAAASDALKKCATLFGVALELYDEATYKQQEQVLQQDTTADPPGYEESQQPPAEKQKMTVDDWLKLPVPSDLAGLRKMYHALHEYLTKDKEARQDWERINLGKGISTDWSVPLYQKGIKLLRWIFARSREKAPLLSTFLTKATDLVNRNGVTWDEVLTSLNIESKSEITADIVSAMDGDQFSWVKALNSLALLHNVENWDDTPF